MDWDLIKLPAPKSPKIQISNLNHFDYWLMFVSAKLMKKSLADVARTAIVLYIKSRWRSEQRDHEDRLALEANSIGITKEEMFMRIIEESLRYSP